MRLAVDPLQAFGIGRESNGVDLVEGGTMWIAPGRPVPDASVAIGPRVGIRRGVEAPPLGPEYWQDTALVVPAELGARFVNALTGERLETRGDALGLGAVFAHFPVALLSSDTP